MPISRGRYLGYRNTGSSPSWAASISLDGGERREARLGLCDDEFDTRMAKMTFEAALTQAHKFFEAWHHLAIRDHNKPSEIPELALPSDPAGYTVAHALVGYLHWRVRNAMGVREALSAVKSSLIPALGEIPLQQLRADHIRAWMQATSTRPAREKSTH